MKNQLQTLSTLLLTTMILLVGCSSDGTTPIDPGPMKYTLNAEASPAEGGSVSPQNESAPFGSVITLQATPTDGWEFLGWSGTFESTDNPLGVSMTNNISMTGNFQRIVSQYEISFTLSDENNTLDALRLGQIEDPETIVEPGAPPPPPPGVLQAWFDRGEDRLFLDYRDQTERDVTWQMTYRLGSGDELSISWEIEAETLPGELTLSRADGSESVDIIADSSAAFSGDRGELMVRYLFE